MNSAVPHHNSDSDGGCKLYNPRFPDRSRYASQSYGYASIYDDENPTEATNLSEKLLGEAMDQYEPALIREYCHDIVETIRTTGSKKIYASKISDMKTIVEVDIDNILPLDR